MIRSIPPACFYIYDGLNREAKVFPGVFFDEIDFRILTFDAEFDDLGYLEVEGDPAFVAVEEVQCEILVIWPGGDEEEIDLDGCDYLLEFVDDGDFEEVFAQLVLGHLEAELLIDFPLNRSHYTMSLSSVCMAFPGNVNF
jgi:hypothetical protein